MDSNFFWDKVQKTSGCWFWTGCRLKRNNGQESYGQIRIGRKIIYAHRMAWELTNGPIPDNIEICHTCDNPICVRPDHLFKGTHSENMNDAKNKHRLWTKSGENHYAAKLTIEQVKQIRLSNLSQKKLALLFNVSPSAIHFILNGRNWKGVAA